MSRIKIESIRHPMGDGQTGMVIGRNRDNQIVKVVVAYKDWQSFQKTGASVGDQVTYNSETREWGRT